MTIQVGDWVKYKYHPEDLMMIGQVHSIEDDYVRLIYSHWLYIKLSDILEVRSLKEGA